MSNDKNQPYDQDAEKPEGPLYPQAHAVLSGQDGDAFNILAITRRALKRINVPADEIQAFQNEATSGDHDHLIQTCMRWVSVS